MLVVTRKILWYNICHQTTKNKETLMNMIVCLNQILQIVFERERERETFTTQPLFQLSCLNQIFRCRNNHTMFLDISSRSIETKQKEKHSKFACYLPYSCITKWIEAFSYQKMRICLMRKINFSTSLIGWHIRMVFFFKYCNWNYIVSCIWHVPNVIPLHRASLHL